ncbi:MAG: HlyD family efflux transporter periplasmic adaptor subunit [Planctomycetota bacterium]|nr:HlyD family efflux transporter periplasmic adaptor subunit [Planctomycetota bacterium]
MAGKRNIVLSIITRVVVCILLLAIGIGIYTGLVRTKPVPARSGRGDAAPQVVVMPAKAVEVRRQWEGFGTAEAMDSADVPARVTATVIEIPTEILPGTWVEEGQLLVRLDDSDFVRQVEITTQSIEDIEAQLARLEIERASWKERIALAEAQVALARAEFDRVTRARESGAAKEREVDQARQALLAAQRDETNAREAYDKLPAGRRSLEALRLGQEAQKRLAMQNVQRCRIVSPLAGVLQTVDVEVGENLAAGQRVARVVDRSRIEVPLRLPAGARTGIAVGDDVLLHATGGGDRTWSARVARIAPEDDEATRTAAVYVELEQDAHDPRALAPGQFLRGTVSSSQPQRRWIVPRRALMGDRLLLVNDGRIVSRAIEIDFQIEKKLPQLGLPDDQWVVLREPLEEGELIVANASRGLPDGVAVTAVPAGSTGEAAARRPETGEGSP